MCPNAMLLCETGARLMQCGTNLLLLNVCNILETAQLRVAASHVLPQAPSPLGPRFKKPLAELSKHLLRPAASLIDADGDGKVSESEFKENLSVQGLLKGAEFRIWLPQKATALSCAGTVMVLG